MAIKAFLLLTLFMATTGFAARQITRALGTPSFLVVPIVTGVIVASFYILAPRVAPGAHFRPKLWVPLLIGCCALAAIIDWTL